QVDGGRQWIPPQSRPWKEGHQGRSPPAPGGISVVKEQRWPSEASGAPPEITAPLRSFGGSPILRRLADPSAPRRSFGASPILRRATDPSASHRSFGAAPKIRSPAEPSEAHRSFGGPPILRRPTDPSEAHRSCGEAPMLRWLSAFSMRHREERLTEALKPPRIDRMRSIVPSWFEAVKGSFGVSCQSGDAKRLCQARFFDN